jgi:tetratricopeptide (TPR) repeat protein
MKRPGFYILSLAILGAYLYIEGQNEHLSALWPAQFPNPLTKPDEVPPELSPSDIPEFKATGYCGGQLPEEFKRPTLAKLLNNDPSPMGNVARRLYMQGQFDSLKDHIQIWQEKSASSAYPSIWLALLSLEKKQPLRAVPHLKQALMLLPESATLALFLGITLSHSPDLHSAMEAFTLYLKSYPQDLPKRQQLARLQTQFEIQSRYLLLEQNGIQLLYPPESQKLDWAAFIDSIDTNLEAAAEFLGTSRRDSLTVIAFEGKAELLATTCTPAWTGGVYDGSIKLAMHNEHTLPGPITLAHETLHAQMSQLMHGPIPAWFSEGMAQAFANEKKQAQSSWRKMVKHQTYIPFSSLGDSFLEFEASEDARLAYHQGLAMVLWLYEEEGNNGIHRAVQALRNPENRQERLLAIFQDQGSSEDFLEFVKTLIH